MKNEEGRPNEVAAAPTATTALEKTHPTVSGSARSDESARSAVRTLVRTESPGGASAELVLATAMLASTAAAMHVAAASRTSHRRRMPRANTNGSVAISRPNAQTSSFPRTALSSAAASSAGATATRSRLGEESAGVREEDIRVARRCVVWERRKVGERQVRGDVQQRLREAGGHRKERAERGEDAGAEVLLADGFRAGKDLPEGFDEQRRGGTVEGGGREELLAAAPVGRAGNPAHTG